MKKPIKFIKKKPDDKKKAEKKQFPKNYRFIPDTKRYLASAATPIGLFYSLSFALIVAGIGLVGLKALTDWQAYRQASAHREQLVAKLSYWDRAVQLYPNYRDAYYEVALLDYQLGNTGAAKLQIKKTLEIDPNFQKGREFDDFLDR